jgi:hypothetical protein
MHTKTYKLRQIILSAVFTALTFVSVFMIFPSAAFASISIENGGTDTNAGTTGNSTSDDSSDASSDSDTFKTEPSTASKPQYQCGVGSSAVQTSINLGCKGNACNSNNQKLYKPNSSYCTDTSNSLGSDSITDMTFAIIKFLSDGVGLVIIASMVVAGIQFTSSRGDPQATATAIKRIQSNVLALFIFFFAYAILNYLVPGQILQ